VNAREIYKASLPLGFLLSLRTAALERVAIINKYEESLQMDVDV
jgi:hypothetical protein